MEALTKEICINKKKKFTNETFCPWTIIRERVRKIHCILFKRKKVGHRKGVRGCNGLYDILKFFPTKSEYNTLFCSTMTNDFSDLRLNGHCDFTKIEMFFKMIQKKCFNCNLSLVIFVIILLSDFPLKLYNEKWYHLLLDRQINFAIFINRREKIKSLKFE